MNILISGGAGFIGSHLTDCLLNDGNRVCVIDNYATGRKENLPTHPLLTVVEGTITNAELVSQTFETAQPDIVIHAAASYKNPDQWIEDIQTNVIGSINIVRASERFGVKRLIYFQTSLCYGVKPLEHPITLSHPLFSGTFHGGSSYAISKTAGEQYIALSTLDFISFRLANVYGPRNLSGPIPTFYHRITHDLPCTIVDTRRDFVFIEDVISLVKMAMNGGGKSGYYHVSSGADVSIQEIFDTVSLVLEQTPSRVENKDRGPDDAPSILLDPTVTNRVFGWSARTHFKDGVRRTIEWYKQNPPTQTFTHLRNIENT